MPENIPDTAGAASRITRSIGCVDHTGDTFSEVIEWVDPAKDIPANRETFINAMAAASSANFFKWVQTSYWAAVEEKSLATEADRSEVSNRITVLCKHPDGRRSSLVIPAPAPAIFQPDTDVPLTSATEFGGVVTAFLGLLEDGFTAVSAKYTSGKQNNESVPV